ncbi:MAG TPA: hypothetical protein DCZ72_00340 [Armatimonadetes bacterium]|nr:hypothetical protein [Armatimonadota bacterium]
MRGNLTDTGLSLDDGRRLAWPDIYFVDWDPNDAVIATRYGAVRVSHAQGRRIEAEIAPWEAQRDAAVDAADPATVATWTGAAPGGSRTDAPPGSLVGLNAVLGLLIGVCIGGLFTVLLGPVAVAVGLIAAPLAGWAFYVSMVRETLTRTPRGFTLANKRFAWHDLLATRVVIVRSKNSTSRQLHLRTRQGRVVVRQSYPDYEALHDALAAAADYRTQSVPPDRRRGWYAPSPSRPDRGLWLDDTGLTVVRGKTAEHYPMASLRAPDWTPTGPVLRLGGRAVRAADYDSGEGLAQRLEQLRYRKGESLTDSEGNLRPEVLEQWLGVGRGRALTCRLHPAAVWGSVIVGLALLAGLILVFVRSGLFSSDAGDAFEGFLNLIAIIVMAMVAVLGSARSLQADAQGLSVRRGRRRKTYAWSDLTEVNTDLFGYSVSTTSGDTVSISRLAVGEERVLGLVRRLLAARETGAALPTTAPLSDTALSPAQTATAPVDTGLSVAPAPQPRLADEASTATADDPAITT